MSDNSQISSLSRPRLWTSSYRVAGKEPNAVAISRGVPPWFRGKLYQQLAPTREMLALKDSAEFDRQYTAILAQLDPAQVFADLAGGIFRSVGSQCGSIGACTPYFATATPSRNG